MLWYVLKTWVGREEWLAKEIRRTVPPGMYKECFVIYVERLWRVQRRSILHAEPLLPGCVFLTCCETEPLFRRLEMVPAMSRMMACGDVTMLPLTREDADFLSRLSGEGHMVRLSYIDKEIDGPLRRAEGPLRLFIDRGQVERYQFKKRYAVVRHRLWGEEKSFVLGILLNEDLEQEAVGRGMGLSTEDAVRATG